MKVERTVSFSEDEVREWCDTARDHNPLHLDPIAARDHDYFDERVVPAGMLLGAVSGCITQWAESKDGVPVISRMTGITFDKPVAFDEDVTVSVSRVINADEDAHVMEFAINGQRVTEAPRATGYIVVHVM